MSDEIDDVDAGDDWAAALAEQDESENKAVETAKFDEFSESKGKYVEGNENLDMILDIPVNISMEIGRT